LTGRSRSQNIALAADFSRRAQPPPLAVFKGQKAEAISFRRRYRPASLVQAADRAETRFSLFAEGCSCRPHYAVSRLRRRPCTLRKILGWPDYYRWPM